MPSQNFRVKNGLEVGTGVTISAGIISATSVVVSGQLTSGSGASFPQINVTGILTATSLVKSGGTSSQFLKADGSTDSSTYLTTYNETDTLNSVSSRGNSTSNGISVGVITATSLVKSGGTSSQFLKADGSVDSSTYLTSYTETDTLNSVSSRGNTTSNGISVGVLTATSLVKSGGTSSQFLKADGSVDSSTYLTSYTETDTLNSVTSRGNTTSNGINVGVLTATSVRDSNGNVRAVPQNSQTSAYILSASDVGKHISITTGGVTVNSGIFSAGDAVSIYNDSGSNQTITQGGSVTMYLVGTATTGNRTLAQRGVATVLCVGSNTFVIMGGGLT